MALDTGAKCHPVEIHFAKDRHQPLKFELRFSAGHDLRVTYSPAGYGRPACDVDVGPVHWDSYPNYFTKESPGWESSEKFAVTDGFWPISIQRYGGDDEDTRGGNLFKFSAACSAKPPADAPRKPYPYPAQDLRNPTPVVAGRWHHLAISWATDPLRGWLSEMYLDGRPALGWARWDTGHGRFLEAEHAEKFYPPLPWPIDEPQGENIVLLGEILDAAVDELRISRAGRYPQGFPTLTRRRFDQDEDMLLLMRFDGNEQPVTAARSAATMP